MRNHKFSLSLSAISKWSIFNIAVFQKNRLLWKKVVLLSKKLSIYYFFYNSEDVMEIIIFHC